MHLLESFDLVNNVSCVFIQKTTSSAPSVKKKPVARLGGLFDNDEDDDELFGSSNFGFGIKASKPSTTKTSEPAKVAKCICMTVRICGATYSYI